jgi:AraC family transcriptional regulator
MTRQSDWIDYDERLRRVTAYIHEHLEEDIDLNRLAEIACLSPCHWHRIYRAIRGETIAATVKRLRLHHAAGRLANSAMDLEHIARRAGYGSVHAFSRAFAETYEMPPATFRKSGSHKVFQQPRKDSDMTALEVEIIDLPQYRLAIIPHKGSYMEIGQAFGQLGNWFGVRNLLRPDMHMIGVYFDDPYSVAENELRSRAGLTVDADFTCEPPLEPYETYAGPYARLVHKGPYSNMRSAYQWLYGSWLPQSGREPADAPCLEEYFNTPDQVPPPELLTAVCLPLRPA